MCILQNDFSDWVAESSKVKEVYRAAYLSILASRSANNDDGLFLSMSDTEKKVYGFEHKDPKTKATYKIFVYEGPRSTMNPSCSAAESSSILDTRGWAAQERILSRRKLGMLRLTRRTSANA